MAFAGLLLVVLGIGGLLAHRAVPAGSEGAVAGGSWTAIGIGVLVMVGAVARNVGRGVYPMAIGMGALVAEASNHWMDNGHVQAFQPWVNIGLLLLIAGGAFFVILELSDDAYETAVGLGVFAAISLGTDIAFDFGSGWDELMNVGTAVFASGIVIAAVVELTDGTDIAGLLARTAVTGFGLTAVLITIMKSFRVPTELEVWLLVPLAVLGGWAAAPRIGYEIVLAAPRDGQFSSTGVERERDRLAMLIWGFLVFGFLLIVLPVEVVVFRPPVVFTIVLIVLALGAGVAAVRMWIAGYRDAVRLIDVPASSRISVGDILEELAEQDAVYRLLPFPGELAEGRRRRSV